MSKRNNQQSLLSLLSSKRVRSEASDDQGVEDMSISPEPEVDHDKVTDQANGVSTAACNVVETPSTDGRGYPIFGEGSLPCCTRECCSSFEKSFQPTDKPTLNSLATDKRRFQSLWYKQFPWLSICLTVGKAYCLYCRFAEKRNMLTFSKMGEKAFTEIGFQNWKKAVEKFKLHEASHVHREALSKWMSRGNQTIAAQLNSQLQEAQKCRRQGLLAEIEAVRYLARQGIAFRNHNECEGNLHQLLLLLSKFTGDVKSWIHENRFTCHQSVSELITLAGHSVLRKLLFKMKDCVGPAWFSIIADEATDVASHEQMSIVIRWVSDTYDIHEDPIGLFKVPNTTAETLFTIIKDVLIRCNLPLSLCRGQAYDGAANMQGKRKGVATRIRNEQPAAVPVHCFAHCLNLCLQDASRKLVYLRDALDTVREISNLIRYSPKRLDLFSTKLQCSEEGGVSLKPLCPTRWTARTGAIDAILKDYDLLLETLEEVHQSTHDEYGMKAGGLQQSLEKFNSFFCLRLCHLLFSTAEQLSLTLQTVNLSLQDACTAVETAKLFYQRIRSESNFNRFYDKSINLASSHSINQPVLPRYRRRPSRYESGSEQHNYGTPKNYHRHQYFEACDLLYAELNDRFQNQLCSPIIAIEKTLLKAANGEDFQSYIEQLMKSCYKDDILPDLKRHLLILPDVIKKQLPHVKKVTLISTICDAMENQAFKKLLPTVHQLLRLYLTLPITSATSERAFSALRRILTFTRSKMTEKTLNNCFMLHVHKEITDELDLVSIAKEFACASDERIKYFGTNF